MSDNIITIENVSKSYNGEKALDKLNLAIKKGEFYGFLGPNGAGKTTTIRMITGIIPPDEGKIYINGLAVNEKGKIAELIGVIPESDGFYQWMSALEYLGFFANLYQVKKYEQQDLIKQLLTQVDLYSKRNTAIGSYSRGMKKRLALARALINTPQILFLDEPTLGLDPQGQEDIQKLLKELNQKGVTVFLSSHLLPEVSNLCSRIAIINKGKLIIEGTMSELLQKTKLKESYHVKIAGDKNLQSTQTKFGVNIDNIQNNKDVSDFIFDGDQQAVNKLIDFLRDENFSLLELSPQGGNLTEVFLSLTKNT